MQKPFFRISVAPMMKYTNRHFRYFIRLMTKQTYLYTEMISTKSIFYGKQLSRLEFSEEEKPLVLQLGGYEKKELLYCCQLAEDMGYDEINFNLGCPSSRVENGNFGVILMEKPLMIADSIQYIKSRISLPISIKHRIGIEKKYTYEKLHNFIRILSLAGCSRFIVHARNAVLGKLSPKENRSIPPLQYDIIFQLKKDFPNIPIELNGGITDHEKMKKLSNSNVDGIMIGRASYKNPYLYANIDQEFFQSKRSIISQKEVIEKFFVYVKKFQNEKNFIFNKSIFSILFNLYHNIPKKKLLIQKYIQPYIQSLSQCY